MDNYIDLIKRAVHIRDLNDLPFVTIWKTGNLYGFNFDDKPIGYSLVTKEGVKRIVVEILK